MSQWTAPAAETSTTTSGFTGYSAPPAISEPPSGRRAAPERLSAPPLPTRTPHETVIPEPAGRFAEVPRPIGTESTGTAPQRAVMSDVSRPTVSEVPRALPGADSAYGLLADANRSMLPDSGGHGVASAYSAPTAFPEPALTVQPELPAAAESPLTRFTEPPRVSGATPTAFPEPVRALTETPAITWPEEQSAATWTPRPLSGLTTPDAGHTEIPAAAEPANPAARFTVPDRPELPRPTLSGPIEPDVSSTSITDSNLPVYRDPARDAVDVALPVRDSNARLPRAARGTDTGVPRLSGPGRADAEPVQRAAESRLTETGWPEPVSPAPTVGSAGFTEPATPAAAEPFGSSLSATGSSLPQSTASSLPRPERSVPSAVEGLLASEPVESTPPQPVGTALPQPISGSPSQANGSSLPNSNGSSLSSSNGSSLPSSNSGSLSSSNTGSLSSANGSSLSAANGNSVPRPDRGAHADSPRAVTPEAAGRPIIRRHQPVTTEPDRATEPERTSEPTDTDSVAQPVVTATPRSETGGSRHATPSRPAFSPTVHPAPEPSYQTTVPAMPVVPDETEDPATVDMRLVMRLMVASNALIAAADAAPASDPAVTPVVKAAHQAHAAAVDVVSAWFGGRGQMREFAAALLAATE
ncbi:hypothetical protein EBN03_20280 [Nocardia stercoris]|uniref:Uncharacterized protein n=1 Tax=Nocardia stercoris TaxID=2483361 RepID=A0A3M2L509_9NOCA|nr:hypothetical protein EBN03_20280 [Nocardia stercoris]